ncbi:MAG: HlyD family efflux transporter periplasmic adaptor subunit [Planctomycetes bacterium]|nr:HlyD family efflux transporter periplasmic adaptor subunit [Planctomycetota bacterium]
MIGIALVLIALAAVLYFRSLGTESTDDAYVNGHVTLVAPRVAGQVSRVLVDDNNRVRKGDVLVQLDPEPFDVQVHIAVAAVAAAEADLTNAKATAWSMAAQARSLRFALQHAIEDVDNQVALLHSKIASLNSQKATLDNAKIEYDRVVALSQRNAAAPREVDDRREAYLVAEAKYQEALQGVYQVRVTLGLPPIPPDGAELSQVPDDLDQTFSSVKTAQFRLAEAANQIGIFDSLNKSPKEMLEDFYKRDPDRDVNRIITGLIDKVPSVVQAQTKIEEAQRRLDDAKLSRRYCDVVAEIDGVVTRRSVNPGNNVVVGQSLMAVRSLTEIWVDANFKETQLADLRIGQPVDLDVDAYGKRQTFKGRISGFTMGTGSTLALLPPQNATGNFVKVVQRLPVRIELLDYDADKSPLFIGLSVTPVVHVNEKPTGPNAGKVLQPLTDAGGAETKP